MAESRAQHSLEGLEVPKRQAEAFIGFSKLPTQTKARVYEALGAIPPQLYPLSQIDFELESILAGTSLDADQLGAAIRSLISSRYQLAKLTDSQYVEAVLAGIDGQVVDVIDEGSIRSAIVSFMALNNIAISYRSAKVLFDDANHMQSASITSELRPVFDVSGNQIEAAVLTHVLRIDFSGRRDGDQIFVALDNSDLEVLEAAVQKARRKSVAIHGFAKGAGLLMVGEGS